MAFLFLLGNRRIGSRWIGASYTPTPASSDAFSEFIIDPIDDLVGGWSAFVTFQFLGRCKFIAVYVAAGDHFNAGEIYDAADTQERQPSVWNVELGTQIVDRLELAVRYGGSDDKGAEFLPESQYGAVLNWGFFESTNLDREYLHGDYEDDIQETETLTVQLAVEF